MDAVWVSFPTLQWCGGIVYVKSKPKHFNGLGYLILCNIHPTWLQCGLASQPFSLVLRIDKLWTHHKYSGKTIKSVQETNKWKIPKAIGILVVIQI